MDFFTIKEIKTRELALDFGADVRTSDWFYMKRLLAELQAELIAKQRKLTMVVAKWIVACEMLQCFEDEVLLVETPSPGERAHYLGSAAILKGHGIHLLSQLEASNLDLVGLTGLSLADISAQIEALRLSELTWGGQHLPAERVAALEALFGGGC